MLVRLLRIQKKLLKILFRELTRIFLQNLVFLSVDGSHRQKIVCRIQLVPVQLLPSIPVRFFVYVSSFACVELCFRRKFSF